MLERKADSPSCCFVEKSSKPGERLERGGVRPRQVRYQAALRPDCIAASILKQIGESFWGGRRESNPQRPEPQSGALPVELLPPHLAIITSGEADELQQIRTRRA